MPEMLSTALTICTVVGFVVIGLLVGIAIHARRHESRPDPPGVRTTATFTGAMALVLEDERAQIETVGLVALGEGLVRSLAGELEARGLEVSEPDADDHGWAAFVTLGEATSYLQVGLLSQSGAIDEQDQDLEADRWMLMLVDPSGGGPGHPSLLPHVHEALLAIEPIEDVRWHARQRFDADDHGEPLPLDVMD